jgi:hypothetical protein
MIVACAFHFLVLLTLSSTIKQTKNARLFTIAHTGRMFLSKPAGFFPVLIMEALQKKFALVYQAIDSFCVLQR